MPPAPQTVTMLSGLGTHELSIVRRGANKKRYAFTKSEQTMDPIKAVISTPAEGEDKLVAALKSAGADDARIEAAVATFRLQQGFSDVLKSEDIEAVQKATKGYVRQKKTDEDEDEDEDEKLMKAKKKAAKKSGDPDLSALDAETQAQVQAIFKSHEALEAKSGKLEEVVKSLVDAGQTREFVAKAEREFSHVPGSATEIASVLKSAHAADPKLGEGLEKILKAANELVAKSALLTPVGVAGGAAPAGSAAQRVEVLADKLTLKSADGSEMSRDQKIAYVLTKTAEGKALYREYLAENPAQRAKHGF